MNLSTPTDGEVTKTFSILVTVPSRSIKTLKCGTLSSSSRSPLLLSLFSRDLTNPSALEEAVSARTLKVDVSFRFFFASAFGCCCSCCRASPPPSFSTRVENQARNKHPLPFWAMTTAPLPHVASFFSFSNLAPTHSTCVCVATEC